MDIKIDFDPKVVAEKLHEAILSTSFAEMFSQKAKESLKKFFESHWGRDNMFDQLIDDVIRTETRNILRTEFLPTIQQKIREQITEEKLNQLVTDVVKNIQIGKERY